MPSFDIKSEVNQVELGNALAQANKEITNRFDFKGSDARVETGENTLFDKTIATFDDDGGAYNQADAGGFIKLNALRMRIAENARRQRS